MTDFDVYGDALRQDSVWWRENAEVLAHAAQRLMGLELTADDLTEFGRSIGMVDRYEGLRLRMHERLARAVADFHQISAALTRVAHEYETADDESRRRVMKAE